MKKLMVFYSFEGNTRGVAKKIASGEDWDLLEIFPQKEISRNKLLKFAQGGKQVLKKEMPKLKEYSVDLSQYEYIFIGTPIWAGTFAPAIRTFLNENSIVDKKICIFCCHEGGRGKVYSAFDKILLENNKIISRKEFNKANKNMDKYSKEIKMWLEEIF